MPQASARITGGDALGRPSPLVLVDLVADEQVEEALHPVLHVVGQRVALLGPEPCRPATGESRSRRRSASCGSRSASVSGTPLLVHDLVRVACPGSRGRLKGLARLLVPQQPAAEAVIARRCPSLGSAAGFHRYESLARSLLMTTKRGSGVHPVERRICSKSVMEVTMAAARASRHRLLHLAPPLPAPGAADRAPGSFGSPARYAAAAAMKVLPGAHLPDRRWCPGGPARERAAPRTASACAPRGERSSWGSRCRSPRAGRGAGRTPPPAGRWPRLYVSMKFAEVHVASSSFLSAWHARPRTRPTMRRAASAGWAQGAPPPSPREVGMRVASGRGTGAP